MRKQANWEISLGIWYVGSVIVILATIQVSAPNDPSVEQVLRQLSFGLLYLSARCVFSSWRKNRRAKKRHQSHRESWQLGEPDLVLKMPEPRAVSASGRDVYRCFVIPIDTDRTVAAVEFRPGNRRVAHDALS